jgi:hypothetical protein
MESPYPRLQHILTDAAGIIQTLPVLTPSASPNTRNRQEQTIDLFDELFQHARSKGLISPPSPPPQPTKKKTRKRGKRVPRSRQSRELSDAPDPPEASSPEHSPPASPRAPVTHAVRIFLLLPLHMLIPSQQREQVTIDHICSSPLSSPCRSSVATTRPTFFACSS